MSEVKDLEELEQELVSHPFDVDLRLKYADALRTQDRYEDALVQYDLLIGSGGTNAPVLVGKALCLLEAGQRELALESYEAGRSLEGFEPNEALDDLAELSVLQEAPAQSAGLHAVPDLPKAEVLAFDIPEDRPITFADVAGMEGLKKTIRMTIVEPFKRPGLFAKFRKSAGDGVLLYGPPGCGKTLMARATAGECGAHFMSVGVSDVLSRWLGEAEGAIAAAFDYAREQRPCVLFFDELDALAYSRSKATSSTNRTLVNEFLSQLDGIASDNKEILVLAASNMPWDVDPAMKRPGRFSRQVFVPPLDAPARKDLLSMRLEGLPQEAIDVDRLAASTDLFSGADLDGLVDLAKESVLADIVSTDEERALKQADFDWALDQCQASTLDWLKTARNLVRYGEASGSYRELDKYLKSRKSLL